MKKITSIAVAVLAAGTALFGGTQVRARAEESLAPACKAAYVCEYSSGTELFEKEATKRLPIASMCKIMTLLLSFEAVDRGEMTYDEKITVSDRAEGMGGSQVYLQSGLEYTAEDLMKTVAVCSANDSCVALAERVAGSEEGFIARMNERAKELGAENTLFANCTGLPKDPQYSCAKDVAAMLRELLKHEKYYEFAHVWLEDFAHPDGRTTQITNTNRMIRTYDGCDGGKTGFTNEAGFCLAATAKRGDMRVISVVIGASDSKQRFADVGNLFDYAFANYETRTLLEAGVPLEQQAQVRGSKVQSVPVAAENALVAFQQRGNATEYTLDVDINLLSAPVKAGDEAGVAVLFRDGVEVARTRLLAQGDAKRFSWWEAYRESAKNWN